VRTANSSSKCMSPNWELRLSNLRLIKCLFINKLLLLIKKSNKVVYVKKI